MRRLGKPPKHGEGKLTQACQTCRIFHAKCDDGQICRSCRVKGTDCVRESSLQFRNQGVEEGSDAAWTRPPAELHYIDETPKLMQYYHDTSSISTPEQPNPVSCGSDLQTLQSATPTPPAISPLSARASPSNDQTSPYSLPGRQYEPAAPFQHIDDCEAVLIRNYVDNMALWADATDIARSFELEVPRRALYEPVLRHAVCALSARHLNRRSSAEALEHQDRCLQLLIPATSGMPGITENILAAVAILPNLEELDEEDNRFLLEGTSHILNTVSDFVSSGGLGEATAWLCLRQDIYVSLTTQVPIRMSLDSFELSSFLRRNDDAAWANKMVLLLAKLLSAVFGPLPSSEDVTDITLAIAEWDRTKPTSFYPVRSVPRDISQGRCFPEMWMLATFHVVGLQYYHIAQIVLAVASIKSPPQHYENLQQHRSIERRVRHHLLRVLGLAKSNPKAENVWFTASHCLDAWGGALRRTADQHAALELLQEIEQRIGWNSTPVVRRLTMQWREDSDDDG